jgi:aspartyl-tRNA(Asn)/glutamyl-tRNA(Gln) amidotransferase subunit B
LRSILQFLGVSTGNMEEGSFRCDANISIRPKGSKELFSKVEVKNMNSFKAVYRALEFEAERQVKVMKSGGKLVQETRGWVDDKGITVSQRSKEYAHDYRYFPEPDLPPMVFEKAWVKKIEDTLPELPDAKRDRFMSQFGLPLYDASLLVDSKAMSVYFEDCVKKLSGSATGNELNKKTKKISNWLLGDFSRLMNSTNTTIENTQVSPESLVELVNNIDKGTVGGPASKAVFEEMFNSGKPAGQIIKEKGLVQISDSGELDKIVSDIISNNSQAVQDFKGGKQQTLGFLVGQAMKMSKGRANPEMVKTKLLEKLGGS